MEPGSAESAAGETAVKAFLKTLLKNPDLPFNQLSALTRKPFPRPYTANLQCIPEVLPSEARATPLPAQRVNSEDELELPWDPRSRMCPDCFKQYFLVSH